MLSPPGPRRSAPRSASSPVLPVHGRAFVELEYTNPNNHKTNSIKITHEDELDDIEQIISGGKTTSPQLQLASSNHPLANAMLTRQTIHEAILDATRMELVHTAKERDGCIDQRLQRYRFFKECNRSLTSEIKALKSTTRDRYQQDVDTPTRTTQKMLRQVAVKSARREMQSLDSLKRMEKRSQDHLNRALIAESKIEWLQAQLLQHGVHPDLLDQMPQTATAAATAATAPTAATTATRSQTNVKYTFQLEQSNRMLQNKIDMLTHSLQTKTLEVEEMKRTHLRDNYITQTHRSNNTLTTPVHVLERLNANNDSHEINETNNNAPTTATHVSDAYHRITHINYRNELDTLKEELRRVLIEFDDKRDQDETTITELKEQNLRFKQNLRRQHWKNTSELD